MKLNKQALALLVALAVVIVGSVLAVSAAQPGVVDQAVTLGDDCGDLRLDEQYACRYGGWEPTPPAGDEAVSAEVPCDDLRLDEYYACRAAGWQPSDDESVRSR